MITERLSEHRNATLDLYRRLIEAMSKVGKSIPNSASKSQKNLEQNMFHLAIVGKVKAGKSTFINALLRKDLLPTDALQATAAIIEIYYAKQPILRVTYANGATEEVNPCDGDDSLAPLKQKLREVAAIHEDVRDLPIAQLNDFIIERYNEETKQAEWSNEEIDCMFLQSAMPNIHQIPKIDLHNRSRSYLEKHRDGKCVAKRVEVGFPSDYKLGHFRIVDTPGICAKGGFAKRTLDFLINADGVIYLHKDEPAEETLHDALQNVIPEKVKKHMLLILTHKSTRHSQANDAYLSEAQKCCPQITKDHIFIVDSLTEIVLQAIYDKEMNQISELCEKNDEWQNCIAKPYMNAKGDKAVFLELMEQQSNMRSLRQEFLRMSEKSLRIQIETVLNAIKELYEELETDATVRRDIYGKKLKDPQQFASEMSRQKEEMDKLQAECSGRVRTINMEFDLNNPRQLFGKDLDKIIKRHEDEINGKNFSSGDTAKTADDYLAKIDQDVDDDLEGLVERIKTSFHHKISDMESSLQADFDITIPKISLTEMLDQLRMDATETVNLKVKRDDWLGRIYRFIGHPKGYLTEEKQQLNVEKFFSNAKSKFINELVAKKTKLADSMKTNIDKACNEYTQSVDRKLNERRQFLTDLQREELNHKDIRKSYDEEEFYVETAKREIAECEKIRGDL